MHDITVKLCTALPPREDLDSILGEYYALIVARMAEIGVPLDPAAPQSALAEFWANADAYLPPKGCLVVARDGTGRIVGCGMLKRLPGDVGELKRVYVTDAARDTGTGRALILAREDAARQMGLRQLIADTLTPNVEMRSLYPKLGFREVPGPIETTTYLDQPMLRPYLHFFVKDL
ncbi:MAG: GNAT family N-acetyltransferase [Pseudomonadota bacterium]